MKEAFAAKAATAQTSRNAGTAPRIEERDILLIVRKHSQSRGWIRRRTWPSRELGAPASRRQLSSAAENAGETPALQDLNSNERFLRAVRRQSVPSAVSLCT